MPSHTERCRSANRFGPGEDFDCICNDVVIRPADRQLADIAQIAFTECQDPLQALARIRGLLDPKGTSGLASTLQIPPLRERLDALCKENESKGYYYVLVASVRKEVDR